MNITITTGEVENIISAVFERLNLKVNFDRSIRSEFDDIYVFLLPLGGEWGEHNQWGLRYIARVNNGSWVLMTGSYDVFSGKTLTDALTHWLGSVGVRESLTNAENTAL